jgi:hypothetical protein
MKSSAEAQKRARALVNKKGKGFARNSGVILREFPDSRGFQGGQKQRQANREGRSHRKKGKLYKLGIVFNLEITGF